MKLSNISKEQIRELLDKNDEDFINQLYLLIRKFLHSSSYEYSEDNVQDCIYLVIKNLKTFDNTKSKFTTWVYTVCRTAMNMNERTNNAQKRKIYSKCVSLDKIYYLPNGDEVELMELIPDNINYDYKKELVNYIYHNCISDLLRDYLNGKTQMELAKEYNVCQAQISRKIKLELKKIKRKIGNGGYDEYEENANIIY